MSTTRISVTDSGMRLTFVRIILLPFRYGLPMAKKVRTGSPSEQVEVVRYLRVSRMGDRLLDDPRFHSPDLQIEAIDGEFDQRFGKGKWKLANIEGNHSQATWGDFNVTGRTMARAGLDAAIDALEGSNVTAIGVLNLSRWGRVVAGALERIDKLKSSGVHLYSAAERIEAVTPEGRFTLTLWLALGALYSEQKAADWSAVIERRAQKGLHHGQPPAGYRWSPTSGTIEPVPEHVGVITGAFASYAEGSSKLQAGRLLVAAGLLATPGQAAKFLANRAYVQLHNSSCKPECVRRQQHGSLGEVRAWNIGEESKRRVDARWLPGKHEGMVPAGLFADVQSRLEQASMYQSGRGREVQEVRHPLQGIVRCGLCNRALALDHGTSGGRIVTFKDSSGMGAGCRGPGAVAADRLLLTVNEFVSSLLARLDVYAAAFDATKRLNREQGVKVNVAAINSKREKRLDLRAQLVNDLAVGESDDPDLLRRRISALENEISQLDQELEQAASRRPASVADPRQIASAASAQMAKWTELTIPERSALLRLVIDAVQVWPRNPEAPHRQPYAERIRVIPCKAFTLEA